MIVCVSDPGLKCDLLCYRARRSGQKKTVSAEEELFAYLRVEEISFSKDLLSWWKEHADEFPRLARMARQYLSVPATSASVERLFSSVGLVKSDLRGYLLDSTTTDLMWAKHNTD